jgi:hypothetical protein
MFLDNGDGEEDCIGCFFRQNGEHDNLDENEDTEPGMVDEACLIRTQSRAASVGPSFEEELGLLCSDTSAPAKSMQIKESRSKEAKRRTNQRS